MTGMLSAFRKTPLYDRLAAEGRLDPSDEPEYGTNVIPLKISRGGPARRLFRGDERSLHAKRPTSTGSTTLLHQGQPPDVGRGRSRYSAHAPVRII